MPNPAASGLPNPSAYDVTVPGIVTDKVTRLIWERSASPSQQTQSSASLYCAEKAGGWRLPTILEMYSLDDFTTEFPAIDSSAFPGTPDGDFWTTTTVAGMPSLSRNINFELGTTNEVSTSLYGYARCVRGFSVDASLPAAKCYQPGGRYSASSAQVFDAKTGLTWQGGVASSAKTWNDALTSCPTVGAGFRLPSVKELLTIVDFNKTGVAIDSVFTGTTATNFWTSTPYVADATYAMVIHFGDGGVGITAKTVANQVRCVK